MDNVISENKVMTRNGWQLRTEAEKEIVGKVPPQPLLHTGRIEYTVGVLPDGDILVGVVADWLPTCSAYVDRNKFDGGERLHPACLITGETTMYFFSESEYEAIQAFVAQGVGLGKMYTDVIAQRPHH